LSKTPLLITGAGNGHNAGFKTGLALAALAGKPVQFTGLVDDNPRPRPGIGPGGITAAAAAAAVTNGHFEGGVGKSDLLFTPGGLPRPLAGDYQFDVARQHKSAAPLANILEVVALPLAAAGAESSLTLMGGSHVLGGFTSDELSQVLAPNWRGLGMDIQYVEVSPGFFPRAKGEATVTFGPGRQMRSLQAEGPFRPLEVGVEVLTSGLPLHLAEQALDGALGRLEVHNIKAKGRMRKARGGTGLAITVWAAGKGDDEYRVGFSALGQRGGRPGAVATTAAEALVSFLHSGAGLPAHLAAALIPALAAGSGVSRLTVDHPSQAFIASAKAADAFLPGCVRLDQRRPQAPIEVRITGLGLM
jgi:RNA 3'-terminal phosphate cyclase (ATP)